MLDLNTLFDNNFYLAQNQDVARAVASDRFQSGIDRFIRFGQFEGRNPSAIITRQPKVITEFLVNPFF